MKKDIRKKVLDIIKPSASEDEKRKSIVETFISALEKARNELKFDVVFFIGGSFGKDTYLKTSSDVDIFARFDKKYDDSSLSRMAQEILDLSGFSYKKQKGSRDYFSLEFKEKKFFLKVELVPNRKIENLIDVVNSTDVSPLHVEFLQSKIRDNPALKDEIRLAKQFFKSKQLYGAESYINGFSGHVIDILISYYGSLEGLLNAAKKWEKTTFIDINGFYKDENEALKKMDSSKISNLILVDPILKERNAARALSEENYYRFLLVASNFDELRENDFVVNKFDLHKIIAGAKKFAKISHLSVYFYIFKLEIENNSEDITGSKLLKLNKKLEKLFVNYDFNVFKNDFFIDMKQGICLFSFMFENTSIGGLKKIKGPFVYMKDAVRKFVENKEYYFIEGDRICSYEKRIYTKIDEINHFNVHDFEEMLNKKLDFVKSIKIMKYN